MNIVKKIANWYFTKKAMPYWIILLFDCLIVVMSTLFVYVLMNGVMHTIREFWPLMRTLVLYLIPYILGFRIFHTYSGVIRFSSFSDLYRVAAANFVGAVVSIMVRYITHFDQFFVMIRAREIVISWAVATLVMFAARIFVKYFYDSLREEHAQKRVFIYGCKVGGMALAKAIRIENPARFSLRGFISDSKDMPGHILQGVKVFKNDEHIVERMNEERADTLLVSPHKTDLLNKNEAMKSALLDAGIGIYIMNQSFKWDGKSDINASQLHEVEIEDLLPRDEIEVNMQEIEEMLKDKCIMVTGSAGSIGSEMVRQIASFSPSQMVLIDDSETPQHDIRLMMKEKFPYVPAYIIVTSITKPNRMESLFKRFKPDYVFHAAAYKHVPMMEDNPSEAVQNNVYGTRIIADLAVKYGVKKFVMISTDKAVNPTNVMGCSKRICEIYVQALDRALRASRDDKESKESIESIEGKDISLNSEGVKGRKDERVSDNANVNVERDEKTPSQLHSVALSLSHPVTQFVTTRFGNVLGSNGSVIPLFKEQIRKGGPVTVTHPDIIRYFMLIPEACKLVLEAGTMGKGGEIFVFDMGKPVKIAELAKKMIQLSGAKNVKIEYTGLRDGEKLYEEVLNDAEITKPTFHKKIKIAQVRQYNYKEVCEQIDRLVETSRHYDDMETVRVMKQIVPEYKSKHSVFEALD